MRASPVLLLLLASCASAPSSRVQDLVPKMTLEEKLGQLQQLDGHADGRARPEDFELARRGLLGSTLNVRGAAEANRLQKAALESRLKIPLLFAFDVIHGYRTLFPIPLGEAAAWDPAAAELSASIAAEEAYAAGVRWVFAPMVDIARDPRWGRVAEGAGEDPYLGSVLARARVRGLQSKGVAACAKHWAAYGAAEGGRDYNSTDVSEGTLREVYFPPFKAAVEAGVATVMSAFNDLNGVPSTANPWTLTSVLRGEWGFDGLVVSDYTAVKELIAHGLAADEAQAAKLALLAGVDMEMVSTLYRDQLPRLVKEGKVPMSAVDEAVRRVLRAKERLGLFERPYADESREAAALLSKDHLRTARHVAARSLVLLKNESQVLPLSKGLAKVAVVGPLADDKEAMLGTWPGDGRKEDAVTLLEGVRAKLSPGARVLYGRGCPVEGGSEREIKEAALVAAGADAVIMALGETPAMNGEAASRSSLDLPGRQVELLRAILRAGKPTVVVLFNGRPLVLTPALEAGAVLEAWVPGTEAGDAVADALFGDENPGGKLPVTFPRSVGQVPIYYNHRSTGRPPSGEKYSSKYIDLPSEPLFPFGFGLSYTRFALSGLSLSSSSIPPQGNLIASVDVQNVGDRAGDEVVQLYIRARSGSRTRPVRELKGFQRVSLKPGERRRVQFPLGPAELGFHDRGMRFVVEPGKFEVFVGTSSVGGLRAEFAVSGRWALDGAE